MIRKFFVPTALALSATLLVSSCGTTAEQLGSFGSGGLHYDRKEKQIIGQARGVGMLLGAGAGYAIAKNNNKSRLGGALAGATAGGLIGDLVGKKQATKARNARLNNDQLRNLISRARANNKKLADYNRQMRQRIAVIRAADPSKRAQMAKLDRIKADRAIVQTDQLIKERKKDSAQLVSSQRAQYNAEISKAQSLRSELVRNRNTLAGME